MLHIPSPNVQSARVNLNYTELSELGKKGAKAKERNKKRRILSLLAGVREKMEQGNEDWCPPD